MSTKAEKEKISKQIYFPPTLNFTDYVINELLGRGKYQKKIFLQIEKLQRIYSEKKYKTYHPALPNRSLKEFENWGLGWEVEVVKMRRCILTNQKYEINYKVTPMLTKEANKVLLLAMMYSVPSIVRYFISYRLFDINESIFGPPCFPSYYLFACSCSDEILYEFRNMYVDYFISWGGLTANLVCAFNNHECDGGSDFDYITYQEYSLLNEFRGVKLKKADKNYPITKLDFLCMAGKFERIKKLLNESPEANSQSRLHFLLLQREHLILLFSR